jgi:hypothetical protein
MRVAQQHSSKKRKYWNKHDMPNLCRASAYLYWLMGWRDAFHHMTQDPSSADARFLVM